MAWSLIELFRASERQGADFEEDVFFGQSDDPNYKVVEGPELASDASKAVSSPE